MRVVAITGGIGSGKSTVTALYRSRGVPAVDADEISRTLTAPGGEALAALRAAFGNDVFTPEGTLDRAALGRLVFGGNAGAMQTLNGIMHPRIIRDTQAQLKVLRDAGTEVAILDAPLLFETGMGLSSRPCVTIWKKMTIAISAISILYCRTLPLKTPLTLLMRRSPLCCPA